MTMHGPWTYLEQIYSRIAFLQAKTSFSKATTPESTCSAWKLNGEVIGWFVDQTWRWNAWDTNVYLLVGLLFGWWRTSFTIFFFQMLSDVQHTRYISILDSKRFQQKIHKFAPCGDFPTPEREQDISSPSCLQDLRPSPCDANDLQWQRHQQHLAYLKSLGSSLLSRCMTKGNDWLHKFAEVKPTAWQWKTQKEDFHRCQRPKRLRHISLRLKSQSTPLLHDGSKMEACGK